MAKKSKIFNYWIPANIFKSTDAAGNEVMKMGGIASTATKDVDDEEIDPAGLDLSEFTSIGTVNWHHGTKEHPTAIIGEPTEAKITKRGLYVECMLYPSSKIAQQVYEVAQILEKDSKTRRLGFSIEGNAIERDKKNSKHITKASITGLAITHRPKNSDTHAEIIKAVVSDDPFEFEDWEIDKADGKILLKADGVIDTAVTGKPLIREDIDGVDSTPGKKKKKRKKDSVKNLTNEDQLTKAEIVANEINNIIDKDMKNSKEAEEAELLEKAWNELGVGDNEIDAILKAKKGKKEEPEEDEDEENDEDEGEVDEGDDEPEDDEDEEEKEDKKTDKKEKKGDKFEKASDADLIKSITDLSDGNTKMFQAVGKVMKTMNDKVDTIQKAYDEQKAANATILDELKGFKSQPQGRKSISSIAIERNFAMDALEKAHKGPILNKVENRTQILGALDSLTFANQKMINPELAKAMTAFESTGQLSPYAVESLFRDKNIVVVG